MANSNIINTLASSFGAPTPVAATVDDEIKVYVKVLEQFQGSELRSKVNDEVDGQTIEQAGQILEKLSQLTETQKFQVRNQLKAMVDEAERQLMTVLINNSAQCPNASSLSEILNFEPEPEDPFEKEDFTTEDETPAQTSVNIDTSNPVGALMQAIAGLLKTVDVNQIRGMLNS